MLLKCRATQGGYSHLALLGATAIALVPVQSFAQENDAIIVTALKREMSVQETPISISAVTGDTLVKSGVKDIAGLNAPSLNFVDGGPSNRRVIIRGIQAAGEPTVGVYYDETPVTGVVGATGDSGGNTPELRLFDVSRVEVLRGPQGTLYGAGSMGGTLRVIYNKPSYKTEFATDSSVSSTHDGGTNYIVNGMVNVPVINDVAALRVSGFYSRDAGWIDNVALGIENINRTKVYGGRAQLRIEPASNVTVDLAAFINRTKSDTNSWNSALGRYKADSLTRMPLNDKFDLYSGTVNWDLGGVNLSAIVSYQKRFLATTVDVTRFVQGFGVPANCARLYNQGAPCDAITLADYNDYVQGQIPSALAPEQDMKTITSELRLSSDGSGSVNWTVGGFFSHRKIDVANAQLRAAADGTLLNDQPVITVRYIDDMLKQVALFGELSWDITDRFNISGGARYYKYNRSVAGETPIGNPLVGATVTPYTKVKSDEDGAIFKLNASYKVTSDIMFYAEAAQGFRPGGVNQTIGLDPSLAPYKSDSLWNYEIGVKSELFDRLLTVNADVFQIDWTDIQITGRTANGAFNFITNAGAARVRGVEGEIALHPATGLTISGNATYTDAKLTENQTTAAVTAPGLKGDRIPFVPKFNAGVSAEYNLALNDGASIMARVDFRHNGNSWSDFRPTGTYTRKISAYNLVNMRVGGAIDDGRVGAYLFVNNLFNETAIGNASSSALVAGRTLVTSAQPRTIGINLQTKF